MGFIQTTLFVLVPTIGYSSFIMYRLGNRLPKVSREFGNSLGMFYRYIKIVMKISKPNNESGELMHFLKKSDFQSLALTRQVTKEFLTLKKEFKEVIPVELTQDPFQKLRLKSETVEQRNEGIIDGTSLLKSILDENQRIKEKEQKRKEANKFFEKIN